MLTIRREQMAVLERCMFKRFEDRMVVRLSTSYPQQCAAMSEPALRDMIREGTKQAAVYRVTAEFDVERYLECMVLYGVDFDTADRTLWAGEILRAEGVEGSEKMNRIDNHETFSRR